MIVWFDGHKTGCGRVPPGGRCAGDGGGRAGRARGRALCETADRQGRLAAPDLDQRATGRRAALHDAVDKYTEYACQGFTLERVQGYNNSTEYLGVWRKVDCSSGQHIEFSGSCVP